MSFDPYYRWLGIPPEEQPADHYRLLGISQFERDANVIETAAERQMLLLKTRQNGPHSQLTQQLMNEVSAARLCLLDVRQKAAYDAGLQRASVAPPAAVSAEPMYGAGSGPVCAPAPEPVPLIADRLWPDDATAASSESPLYPATPLQSAALPGAGVRRAGGAPTFPITLLIVFGGLTAFGLLVIGAAWLFMAPDDGAQRVSAGTPSSSAQPDVGRPLSGPKPPLPPSGARPPQPPGPRRKPPAPPLPATPTLAAPAGGSPPVVRQPGEFADVPVAGGSVAAATLLEEDEGDRPTPQPRAGIAHAPMPAAQMPPAMPALPAGSPPPPAAAGSRGVLEFDLSAALAKQGPENVLLAPQFPGTDATWELSLEDYGSPSGSSAFSIGSVSTSDGAVSWPIVSRSAQTVPAQSTDGASGDTLLAHLESGPGGLSLKFSPSATPERIDRLTVCGLTLSKLPARQTIQLRTRERIAPVPLSFHRAKEAIALEGMPAPATISGDRIQLEIQRLDISPTRSLTVSLQAQVNEEVTVPLDLSLACELGVTLSDAGGQYQLVLIPRYMVNNRRQQLVPTEVRKDLNKAKASLTRNQRELQEAQAMLAALPGEIDRVQSILPRNVQERHERQVQVTHLQQMGASLESKISRLSGAANTLQAVLQRTEQVIGLLEEMGHASALHFRVIARGDAGDLVLLDTSRGP